MASINDIKLYNDNKEELHKIANTLRKLKISRSKFYFIFKQKYSVNKNLLEKPVYQQFLIKKEEFTYKKPNNVKGHLENFCGSIGIYIYRICMDIYMITLYDHEIKNIQKYIVDSTQIADYAYWREILYKNGQLYIVGAKEYYENFAYNITKNKPVNYSDIYIQKYSYYCYEHNRVLTFKKYTDDIYRICILLNSNIPKKHTNNLDMHYVKDNKTVFVNKQLTQKLTSRSKHYYIFINPIYHVLEDAFCDDINRLIWSYMYECSYEPVI